MKLKFQDEIVKTIKLKQEERVRERGEVRGREQTTTQPKRANKNW